jgi:Uma2 family endonuclease
MSAQPAYDSTVDHKPRFFAHSLPTDRPLTWDDLETIPDDARWAYELIEGALFVALNTPNVRHQSCVGSLQALLRRACSAEFGVLGAPFSYVPGPGYSLQPDVLLAREPIQGQFLESPPVLVVEVLSPHTRRRDQTIKRSLYENNGVEHYWLVDPAGPSIEALRLIRGRYAVVAQAGPGETFRVADPVQLSFDPELLLSRRG